MSKLHLKWKHVFLAVIILSIIFGIFLGFFCIKQGTNPGQFIKSFWIGKRVKASPAKVVAEYLKAWEGLEPKTMYSLLTKKTHEITPEDKYVKDFNEFPIRPIEHKIISTVSFGKKASVVVVITWPSLEAEPLVKEEKIVLFLEDNKWNISEQESFQ